MTLIRPEDLDFPNTMTDIEYDTWMLSGSAIMQDGSTIRNGYMLDLDTLQVRSGQFGQLGTSFSVSDPAQLLKETKRKDDRAKRVWFCNFEKSQITVSRVFSR